MKTRNDVFGKIRWDAFGTNFYAWGLIHYNGDFDDMAACGVISTARPPMRVHRDETVTCLACLALGGLRAAQA